MLKVDEIDYPRQIRPHRYEGPDTRGQWRSYIISSACQIQAISSYGTCKREAVRLEQSDTPDFQLPHDPDNTAANKQKLKLTPDLPQTTSSVSSPSCVVDIPCQSLEEKALLLTRWVGIDHVLGSR